MAKKTADTSEKAKEKTKDAGKAIADTTKDAADKVVDAVTPDADARKIEVKLTEHHSDRPKSLGMGKTAFIVRNAGKEKHNFAIKGEGIEKKFFADIAPESVDRNSKSTGKDRGFRGLTRIQRTKNPR